tara:strand:- start:364 stop:2739 length:2376 start_codon:yes stop_codon:yes gene_type:complete
MSENNKTINLEVNGRIFPSWILKNFKKYVLPEINRKEGDDPCNEKIKNELTTYQRFLGQYLNYTSPFKDVLVFHGLGSGKTVTAINIYNVLFNYTPKWNVFILIPASLRDDPWLKDLKEWLGKSDYSVRMKNIEFIHYDSPYADRDFLEKVKTADKSKPTLYIFDEAHNFIRNTYNNISSKKGKRAQVIYDYIQQEKKEGSDIRIVMLTATPAVNSPYEYALYFNLMRPGAFPDSEAIFSQIYISSTNFESLNEETKNMFQRRILGLVSYYIGATPDKFAQKTVYYKNVLMGEYHERIYEHFEEIEEAIEKKRMKMARGKVGEEEMSTYSSYTRQASNFVFPTTGKISGEERPRPGKFRIKNQEAEIIDLGKDKKMINELKNSVDSKKISKKNNPYLEYLEAIRTYSNNFIDYLKNLLRKDKESNHSLQKDIEKFFNKYNSNFDEFEKSMEKKSNVFKALYDCSPKFVHIIFNILKSKGPTVVYSNYVEMEGLGIFKIYLSFFGFLSISDDKDFKMANVDKKQPKDFFRFMEFHGGIDNQTRDQNKKIYNLKENKNGKLLKIILISPAGTEGINLRNTRQVHITEPYWNEVRIEQIIGRAIRICSHADIPMAERKVEVFRYKMIRSNGKETTDEKLESIARKKNNLLVSFTDAVKEAAIDCELFKNHNMLGIKYKCFKFNQDSLFDVPIGPAYAPKLDYDFKMNDGSNSKDSYRQKIKVMKIKAVMKINDNTFSEEKDYWYHKETGVVYNYSENYAVGKVEKDNDGNEQKLDSNTYIISTIIDIPTFKLYD